MHERNVHMRYATPHEGAEGMLFAEKIEVNNWKV